MLETRKSLSSKQKNILTKITISEIPTPKIAAGMVTVFVFRYDIA